MSVYTKGDIAINNGELTQTETNLYGSSRLGMSTLYTNIEHNVPPVATNMPGLGTGINITFTRGKKIFELDNHLGNVLATVSDVKRGVSVDGSTIDHYEANVVSAQDYYPFGMQEPGRSWNAGKYRYGFNGKENDNDVKGEGNQQDYGMRVYDPRAGRFLSVDPLTRSYPMLTPYQYAENDVIRSVDLDGLERYVVNNYYRLEISSGKPKFMLVRTEKMNCGMITVWQLQNGLMVIGQQFIPI